MVNTLLPSEEGPRFLMSHYVYLPALNAPPCPVAITTTINMTSYMLTGTRIFTYIYIYIHIYIYIYTYICIHSYCEGTTCKDTFTYQPSTHVCPGYTTGNYYRNYSRTSELACEKVRCFNTCSSYLQMENWDVVPLANTWIHFYISKFTSVLLAVNSNKSKLELDHS